MPGPKPSQELLPKLFLLAALTLLTGQASARTLLTDVSTDKARYAPGVSVVLSVTVSNDTAAPFYGSLALGISHLGYSVTNLSGPPIAGLGAGATITQAFSWTPPAVDYQGYLVSVAVQDTNGNLLDNASTALDVSSDWAKFPRYGYLAHYDSGLDATNILRQLNRYHLNGLQFYDWQYKHHVPYSPTPTWPDIANRTIYRGTVTNFIAAAHSFNMVAMNYNLYGAAYDNYLTDGSGAQLSMGIFSGTRPTFGYAQANQMNVGLPAGWATSALYEMNNRDAGWQNYIFGKEQQVFNNLPFDGWHIDSF